MSRDIGRMTVTPPIDEEATRLIEEAAYYHWLNRGRYALPGNELNDWLDAERQVRAGSL